MRFGCDSRSGAMDGRGERGIEARERGEGEKGRKGGGKYIDDGWGWGWG